MVPELRGKTITQASKLLADRDLCAPDQVTIHADQSSGRLPTVVDQAPPPGTRVDRGTYITFSARARAAGALYVDRVEPCSAH